VVYEFPGPEAPIRQGDIFTRLPRIEFSLARFQAISEHDEIEVIPWDELAGSREPVAAIVAARPVVAIVVSQDCDALRAPDITLSEIREFRDVERKGKDTTEPKSWMRIITQQARINQKWFYLPPDDGIGFQTKMAVDFMVTLCVPRSELAGMRHLRKGRLNEAAGAHFRERIAEFYRRYPFDEWYPLDEAEFEAYKREHPDAQPFPWQARSTEDSD